MIKLVIQFDIEYVYRFNKLNLFIFNLSSIYVYYIYIYIVKIYCIFIYSSPLMGIEANFDEF